MLECEISVGHLLDCRKHVESAEHCGTPLWERVVFTFTPGSTNTNLWHILYVALKFAKKGWILSYINGSLSFTELLMIFWESTFYPDSVCVYFLVKFGHVCATSSQYCNRKRRKSWQPLYSLVNILFPAVSSTRAVGGNPDSHFLTAQHTQSGTVVPRLKSKFCIWTVGDRACARWLEGWHHCHVH